MLVQTWGETGSGDGQFRHALAIGVDGQENVYVSEAEGRIQKFDSDGKFLTAWGSVGSGDGQFLTPTDLAIDSRGLIFVADKDNNRIDVFGDPSVGAKHTTWGRLKALYR